MPQNPKSIEMRTCAMRSVRDFATTTSEKVGFWVMGNMVQPDIAGSVRYRDAIAIRPVGDGTWRFKIGQCVSHKDQSMPSLVLSRIRTSAGGEVYGVRSFATADPNRDRMILRDSLVDVVMGSEPCVECLLFNTSLCPAV